MLELAGLVLLVLLVLVGALLPLKHTARMHLPKPRAAVPPEDAAEQDSTRGRGDP